MLIKIVVLLLVFSIRSSYATEENLNNFTLTGYDKQNNKKWEIEGESAQLSKEDVALRSVKARLYGDNGPVNMRADRGFLNRVNRQVELTGNVVIKNSEGDSLFTDILHWDQDREVVWTEERLRIVKNDSEVSGEGG